MADQGLYSKFIVTRRDGTDKPGCKHDGCDYFVLDVTHDPHAIAALQVYAEACRGTHPNLSKDLLAALPVKLHQGLEVNVCDAEGSVIRTGKVGDPGGPGLYPIAAAHVHFDDGTFMYFNPHSLKGLTGKFMYRPDPNHLPAEGYHLTWATQKAGFRKEPK